MSLKQSPINIIELAWAPPMAMVMVRPTLAPLLALGAFLRIPFVSRQAELFSGHVAGAMGTWKQRWRDPTPLTSH